MGRRCGRLGDHPRHLPRRGGDHRVSPAHTHDERLGADRSQPVVVSTGSGGAFRAGPDLDRLPPGKRLPRLCSIEEPGAPGDRCAAAAGDRPGGRGGHRLRRQPRPRRRPAVAATTARFRQALPRMGRSVDLGGSRTLPRPVGPQRAEELLLPGGELPGEGLRPAGLVSRALSPEELDRVARKLARWVAGGPTIVDAGANRLLEGSSYGALTQALDRESIAQSLNITEPDSAEGVTDFSWRREPVCH